MAGVIRRETVPSGRTFSFADVERDAERVLAEARERAAALTAEAEREWGERLAMLQEEARRTGFEQGRKEGHEQLTRESRAQALADAQAEISQLIAALRAGLTSFEAGKRSFLAQAETGIITLALAIAQRVCKTTAGRTSDVVVENARALLELVRHQRDVTLTIHPSDHETLQAVVDEFVAGFERLEHIELHADERVEPGGCVVRTLDGEIDGTIETQLQRIADAIGGATA